MLKLGSINRSTDLGKNDHGKLSNVMKACLVRCTVSVAVLCQMGRLTVPLDDKS